MQLKDPALFREQAYIDGVWVSADTGKSVEVTNPATGVLLGHVPDMGAEEARRAIERRMPRKAPGPSAPPRNALRFSGAGPI